MNEAKVVSQEPTFRPMTHHIFSSLTIPVARSEDNDWPRIQVLNKVLKHLSASPVAALNHAITGAMVYGLSKKLNLIQALKLNYRITGLHHLKAAGVHLLETAGAWEADIAR